MTPDAEPLSGNGMGRRNTSEPVRLGEILPEVMAKIALRIEQYVKLTSAPTRGGGGRAEKVVGAETCPEN